MLLLIERRCNQGRYPYFRRSLLLIVIMLLSGCISNLKNLAKSDVDMVVDQHILELNRLTNELTTKLYKRNPRELLKAPGQSLERRLKQLNRQPPDYRFPELGNSTGATALQLAFNADYRGDRVFAMMIGMKSMLHTAYGMRTELFLLDELDHQALYNSARNLEIINWRLNNRRDENGEPYLLSNGYQNGIANLSFERLFGKMILIQDMMAKVVADKNNRTITSVVHSVASTALLPVPL